MIQEATWSLLRHAPDPAVKDIFLFAGRRGGSSWVRQVIGAAEGVREIDQPFSYFTPGLHQFEHLPIYNDNAFIDLAPDEEAMVRTYIERLCRGEVVVGAPWQVWQRRFWKTTNRVLLKITNAKPLVEWFGQNFDAHILVLLRHPISQALSVKRAGWRPSARAFLRSPEFTDRWLEPAQVDLGRRVMAGSDELKKHVLSWCLENLVIARTHADHPEWTVMSYEECVFDHDRAFEFLADRLEFEVTPTVRQKWGAPAKSTRITHARKDVKKVTGPQQLSRWRSKVTEDQEASCFEILDAFGIDLYSPGENLPRKDLLQSVE